MSCIIESLNKGKGFEVKFKEKGEVFLDWVKIRDPSV